MINMNEQLILRIIQTLKEIDVRGFESMDRLVGLVKLFNEILQAIEKAKADAAAKEAEQVKVVSMSADDAVGKDEEA